VWIRPELALVPSEQARLVAARLDEVNRELARREIIKRHVIAEAPLGVGDGTLTSSFKLRPRRSTSACATSSRRSTNLSARRTRLAECRAQPRSNIARSSSRLFKKSIPVGAVLGAVLRG
jgi:hypothetical protein